MIKTKQYYIKNKINILYIFNPIPIENTVPPIPYKYVPKSITYCFVDIEKPNPVSANKSLKKFILLD